MKSPQQAKSDWDAYLASKQPKTEHALQVAVVNWCRSLEARNIVKERFAAIPNGAFLAGNPGRRAAQASKLKAEGMRSGMPDLIVWKGSKGTPFISGEVGRVLWLELKNGKKGVVSPEQKAIHADLIDNGFTVKIIRTLDDAKAAITEFYQV